MAHSEESKEAKVQATKHQRKKDGKYVRRICDSCGAWFSTLAEDPDMSCMNCFERAVEKAD